MSRASRFKARLFLEGLEVPFQGASITAAENSIQFANISLVPHESIKFIKPKTLVQLYVKDTLNFGTNDYYLAFEGEVTGRGYGKSQDGRSFSIMATDFSGYWDEAKAYFYNPNFLLGKLQDITIGDAQAPATDAKAQGGKAVAGASNTNSFMIQVINSAPDLVQGVVKILSTLGQVNIFYKNAYSRLRISDRIAIRTSGRVKEFLKELNIEEFLKSYTGIEGGTASLRDMLNSIMGLVFHSFISIPFPARVSSSSGELTTRQFLFVPDGYPLPPPKCNVIFPHRIINFTAKDNFKAMPTRLGFQPSLPSYIPNVINKERYQIFFYPKSFYNYMYNGGRDLGDENGSLLGPSTLFRGSKFDRLKYGDKQPIETAINPATKEQDFLTNEESIKGIFYEKEVFSPGVTALVSKSPEASRNAFFNAVGEYVFFKKRFSSRQGESLNLMFSPFVVPGFNGVILDDSDAGQSIMAKFQVVTHNITHNSAITTIQFGYWRDFDEVDALSGGSGEPPLPTWFDTSIFGKKDKTAFDAETKYLQSIKAIGSDEASARNSVKNPTTYPKMSDYYTFLLGSEKDLPGSESITDTKTPSIRGAVSALLAKYRSIGQDEAARDAFTFSYVRRPVQTLASSMAFMGARPSVNTVLKNFNIDDVPEEFAIFVSSGSGRYDGSAGSDADVVKLRRDVILKYFQILKNRRSFRG